MDFIKQELEDEFNSIGIRSQRKNLKVLKQTGKSDLERDEARKALAPGKRISKTGKIYWETRKSRSDQPGKKV